MGLRSRISPAVTACAIYVVLRGAAHFSATLFEVSPGISIWYPPCGLALSLLVLLGFRTMPLVFAANLALSGFFPDFELWWIPAALSILNTVNYAAAAWVARRFLGSVLLPGETRATIIFALIVVLSPATMSLGGNLILLAHGITHSREFWHSVLNWWVGDVSGLLTVVPPIMVFAAPLLRGDAPKPFTSDSKDHGRISLIVLQCLVLIGCLVLVFVLKPFGDYNLFYLCFLPLIWICFCHGLVGATLATLAITMTGLIGLHLAGSTPPLVMHFLLFELAIACVGLGLGSAVSRRNKVARALISSQAETARLSEVIEATTDFVFTADADLRILYANTSLVRLLGKGPLASLRGQPLFNLFPTAIAKRLEQEALPAALASGAWHGEPSVWDGARREIPVSMVVQAHHEGDAVLFSFVLRNIAQQKQDEADRLEGERRLQQVQKLESLGVLAGGIAHDFNNLLTPLLGYASLARLDLPDDSPLQRTLDKIEKSTERAAALCKQMLAYAGRNPLAFSDLDLSLLIEDTAQLLQVSSGKKRSLLQFELTKPLPRITADSSQMRQILMNLVSNAAEAIGDNQGRIVVRTREETLDKTVRPLRFHGRTPDPGRYIVLEVEDTGSGMTPEVYARIFEPFFSTKFAGHGLGLAAVLGIVKSHNGAIQVKSTKDQGTLFSLFFPAIKAPPKTTEAPFSLSGNWRGSGQVLIVDDEPDVCTVLARALEVSGFTSQSATDGAKGVEYFKKHSSELRLVLLDLTMPVMDGEQAFHEMHRINPEIPVILMSGYSQKLSLDRFTEVKPAAFLSKPFDYRVLQKCLRQLPAFQSG